MIAEEAGSIIVQGTQAIDCARQPFARALTVFCPVVFPLCFLCGNPVLDQKDITNMPCHAPSLTPRNIFICSVFY